MDNQELAHHGTKGMRWGIRRYQTKDGKLTPLGKRRYLKDAEKAKKENEKLTTQLKNKQAEERAKARVDKILADNEAKRKTLGIKTKDDIKAEKKAADEQKQAEAKAEAERAKEEAHQKAIVDAIKTGKAKDIESYKKELTPAQINDIQNRINLETKLSELRKQESMKGMERVDLIMKKVGKTTEWVDTGSKFYNSVAKVVNTFGNKDLPIIGESKKGESALDRIAKSGSLDDIRRHMGEYDSNQMKLITQRLAFEDNLAKRGTSSTTDQPSGKKTESSPTTDKGVNSMPTGKFKVGVNADDDTNASSSSKKDSALQRTDKKKDRASGQYNYKPSNNDSGKSDDTDNKTGIKSLIGEWIGRAKKKSEPEPETKREPDVITLDPSQFRDVSDDQSRSTPKALPAVTSTAVTTARVKALRNSGYTIEELAKKLGVSPSTVSKYLNG